MTAGEDEGHVEPLSFRPWCDRNARLFERPEIRTEALHSADRRRPALRQAKTRRGAEEEDAVFCARQFKGAGIERVEKRPDRVQHVNLLF